MSTLPEYVKLLPGFDSEHTGEVFKTSESFPRYKYWPLCKNWGEFTFYLGYKYISPITKEEYETVKGSKQNNMKNKKIIGYKCPMKLEGDNITIPIGGLFKKKETSKNYHYEYCFHYGLPKEIVEQWEPVYEEEFKVGDWVTDDDGKNVYEIYQIDKDGNILVKVEGGYGIPQNSLLRKATPEEIKKAQNIILYFDDVEFELDKQNKFYKTKFGTVTLKELEDMINWFTNPPYICGYPATIHDKCEEYFNVVTLTTVGIGCKKGTIKELIKLRDTLKKYL